MCVCECKAIRWQRELEAMWNGARNVGSPGSRLAGTTDESGREGARAKHGGAHTLKRTIKKT